MSPYLNAIIYFLVGIISGLGVFFLIRSSYRAFNNRKIVKGIWISLVALVAALIALIYIIAGIGWLMIVSG